MAGGKLMIRYLSALALASLAIGLAPAATAQAAAVAPAAPLPNPCRTFTVQSARVLLHVSSHTHLSEKLTSATKPFPSRTCTVRRAKQKLTVVTQHHAGGLGMGLHCYKRPKLGSHGEVCVSTVKAVHFSFVVFRKLVGKHGVYLSDGINETLPHQGNALYTFALAQRKAL
jgi:hypothetical protein